MALREGQKNVHAIDLEHHRVVGKWSLPEHPGRTWTAIAGGATHLFLASQGEACRDTPDHWIDSKGYSCKEYLTKNWCTGGGHYGRGWYVLWGTFEQYKNLE